MPNPESEKKPGVTTDVAVQKKLEQLRKEYADLHTQKITTAANIKNLEDHLAKLRVAAEKDYGTSDIEELQRILAKRRRENEAQVTQYEQHIKEIKENLADIERTQTEVP